LTARCCRSVILPPPGSWVGPRTTREHINSGLDIDFAEPPDVDAEHTHSDVSKAQELLGYEPSTSIREGVGAFIDWYRENRDWYEPLVLES
jgi:UDP-glucose 4-epimerase